MVSSFECFQAVKDSEIVEVSEDSMYMRAKANPDQWPLTGATFSFSTLNANVPEFVPGQPFVLPEKSTEESDENTPASEFNSYSTPVLSSSAPELEGNWQEVKKRVKERTPKKQQVCSCF